MYHIYIHFGKKLHIFSRQILSDHQGWLLELTAEIEMYILQKPLVCTNLLLYPLKSALMQVALWYGMIGTVCKIIWFCWIWLVRCWLTNKYTICVLTWLPPGSQITLQSHNAFTLFFQQKSSFARGASLQSWSGDLVGEEAAPAALARPAPAPAPRLGLQVAVGHGGEKQQPVPRPGL